MSNRHRSARNLCFKFVTLKTPLLSGSVRPSWTIGGQKPGSSKLIKPRNPTQQTLAAGKISSTQVFIFENIAEANEFYRWAHKEENQERPRVPAIWTSPKQTKKKQ